MSILLLNEEQLQIVKAKALRVPKTIKSLNHYLMLECIGTLVLVFGICSSAYYHPFNHQSPNAYEPFLISCYLYFSLSIAAPFTGGHLNPSITIGMYLSNKLQKNKVKFYIIGQLVGGLIGAFIPLLFSWIAPAPYIQDEPFIDIFYDFLGEIVGTFLFVVLVLYVVETNQMKIQYFNYMFIAFSLLLSRTFTFRKQVVNPAVSFALQITASIRYDNYLLIFYSIGLIIGQVIGSVFGYLFFCKFYYPLIKQVQSK